MVTQQSRRFMKRHKTPTVLQMEAVECGAAALGIVLRYYGKYVSLEKLRADCGVSRDGSKASNVIKAAREHGLKARGFSLSPKKLLERESPLIIFWNFNHFLVLEGIRGDLVYLNDPGTGPRTVLWDEFDAAFSGITLTFEPDENFVKDGKKPSSITRLARRLSGSWGDVGFLIAVGIALVIPGLIAPIFTKIFVDNILVGEMGGWMRPLLLVMTISVVITGLLTWLREYFLIRLETKLAIKETASFLWHVLRLPVLFYTQRSSGDIANRVGINDSLAKLMSRDLMTTALDLISVLFFGALLFFYDVFLASIGLAMMVGNVIYLNFVSKKRKDLSLRSQQDQGKLAGTSMNGISAIETLKASGRESDFFSLWAGYHAKVFNSQLELGRTNVLLGAVPVAITALNTAAIVSIGGLRVIEGHLTMGELAAFQALMGAFVAPITGLVGVAGKLQQLEGDMTRIDDVLQYELDPVLGDEKNLGEAGDVESGRLAGRVTLKDVTFGYSRTEKPLINNFSLEVEPGRKVALVGPSGSGKSTVAKVIVALYQHWEGEIFFDGNPRSKHSRRVMSKSLAMVDQNISVVPGTVRDNLTLWDGSIDDAAIIAAARDAEIHEIIAARNGGYDSEVAEGGTNFSGGQLQRLEIARALVNEPSILVLDEATSALDPVTEAKILQNLSRRGCTCIVVAHRLSTIRDCDEIVVLQGGVVTQRGTHDQLLSDSDGLYASLIGDES